MNTLSSRFTLQLPDYWTPEQALAVFELLKELTEAVWNRYELSLIELLSSEITSREDAQQDLFNIDEPRAF